VSALARWRKAGRGDDALNTPIDRGTLFLLQSADAGGAWSTSQATISALMALLDTWSEDDSARAAQIEVRVNGVSAGVIPMPAGRTVRAPLLLDVSGLLRAGANALAFVTGGDQMPIVLGPTLAATPMEMFRLAQAETEE